MTPPVTMPSEAHTLIRRYYTYAGIYTLAASIIWGINTLFLLDAGLSIAEVFIANAAFSVGTVLFEIPTGVVADTIGRRASFLLSLIVLAASTMFYVSLAQVGGGVLAFSLVSVFMGLGFTFYSGAMEAWLVDGVRELGYDGDMDSVFATAQIVGGGAMLVGTIGGGLLGQIDLALPFILRSVLLIALLFLAFFGMHDIGFQRRSVTLKSLPKEAKDIASSGIRNGWRSRPLRMIMIGGAIQNGFFFWAWYAWQPYFLDLLERDAVWVAGVVAALLSVAMIVGNALVKFFTQYCGRRTTMLLWTSIAFGFGSIGVGVASNFAVALGFLLVAAVAMGVQMPVRQAFIHNMVTSEERATVVSFDSMITGIGAVGGQAGLGIYSERQGYSLAYIVGGAITLLALPFVWAARRTNTDADFFEGSKGIGPSCVPHGLPSLASVDSTPDS
ncbi:MAG: MFS transporter [Acidimicrobiia bacterium]|nr:MAG: MFS transporter [Acidimicrobiia bacterium]